MRLRGRGGPRRDRGGRRAWLAGAILLAGIAGGGVTAGADPGSGPGAGCPASTFPPSAGGAPIVLAASSLRDLLPALMGGWAEAAGRPIPESSLDSSGAHRARIEAGAPADLLIAADGVDLASLAAACLLRGTPVPVAESDLAIVVAAGNPEAIRSVADLARPGLRIVATLPGVPLGRYAETVLARAADGQADPVAWRAAVEANVISREESAATVRARVVLGEADAALLYRTDALGDPALEGIAIPADANVRVVYLAAIPATGGEPALGGELLAFLAAPEARAILAAAGFLPPPGTAASPEPDLSPGATP